MPIDPNEDMYSCYYLEIINRDQNIITLHISELHNFGNLPIFSESFLLNEMLDNYIIEIGSNIANHIFYEMNRKGDKELTDFKFYKDFKEKNPNINKFMNWFGASHGDFFLTTQTHYKEIKNSSFGDKKHKDKHGADIYNSGIHECKNENVYYYQTYTRIDNFEKIAQTNIFNLELIDSGKNKENKKEWVLLQFIISNEIEFLIPSWQENFNWKSSQYL